MKRMNLQLFAEPTGGAGGTEPPAGGQNQQQTQTQTGQQASLAIDYAKIQQMLEGTLAAKEDTALKAYFKQQGLSQEEVEQAIAAFKQQKAASQPDVAALQQQATQAQALAQQAQMQAAATMAAVSLGIDAKTIPYVLKMADLGQVMGQDGKINDVLLWSSFFVTLVARKYLLLRELILWLCCGSCLTGGTISVKAVRSDMVICHVRKFFHGPI